MLRETAGGFDELRIVERYKRLKRRIRALAGDDTSFASRDGT